VTEERLSGTNKPLSVTEERLSGTNKPLSVTEERLSRTNKPLSATEERLLETDFAGKMVKNRQLSASTRCRRTEIEPPRRQVCQGGNETGKIDFEKLGVLGVLAVDDVCTT